MVDRFQKTKSKYDQSEVEQRKLLGSLFGVNQKIRKVVQEKSQMESEQLVVDSQVKELAAQIMNLENKSKEQKSRLRERIAVIYKLGGSGIARILFSSSSSTELERNLKILGIVAKNDIELIRDFAKSQRELQKRKLHLTKRWDRLKRIEKNIEKKEALLLAETDEKNKILDRVKKTQKKALAEMALIRKKSKQMISMDEEGVLDLLFQPSFAEKKGTLKKPVQGLLSQGYGLIRADSGLGGSKVVFSHRGHLYQTEEVKAVKSIFSGAVAFVGEIPGYGETIILDHGDHYYSVYSYLQNIQVRVGHQVEEQQRIADTGKINSDSVTGVYFEIRHFSEPSDPKLWVRGS